MTDSSNSAIGGKKIARLLVYMSLNQSHRLGWCLDNAEGTCFGKTSVRGEASSIIKIANFPPKKKVKGSMLTFVQLATRLGRASLKCLDTDENESRVR